jgi:hypothetical protein
MNVHNSDLIQAIRGPIMLITLGALVSFDYFLGISFTQRTWPVLVIVFGLLKLLEKSQRRHLYPGSYGENPPLPPQEGPTL